MFVFIKKLLAVILYFGLVILMAVIGIFLIINANVEKDQTTIILISFLFAISVTGNVSIGQLKDILKIWEKNLVVHER